MARAESGAVIIGRHVLSSDPAPEGPAAPGVSLLPSLLTKKTAGSPTLRQPGRLLKTRGFPSPPRDRFGFFWLSNAMDIKQPGA